MASIITATTTSGLTQSADNSGVLQLASGTGNLVTIPSVTGTAMVSGNMPAFSAWASLNTTLSNATLTKVNFQTEEYDTNNNFASSRFTPTVAGYYLITASLAWSTGTFPSAICLYKNGSRFKDGVFVLSNSTTGSVTTLSAQLYLNGSTDYVEIYGYQASGGNSDANATSTGTFFQGVLVRAA